MDRQVRFRGDELMKAVGIREGKAKLSELVRAALEGEPTLLTDYGKPAATLSAAPNDEADPVPVKNSDPNAFRAHLLALLYPLDLDF
jgi:prevent-host-death family protein